MQIKCNYLGLALWTAYLTRIWIAASSSASPTSPYSPTAAPFSTEPQLFSATFSNDGTHIIVSFTAATNQANFLNGFMCSKILAFPSAANSSCLWTNASTIAVYPATSELVVGSSIAITTGNGVKAACPSSVSSVACASWAEALYPTSVVIQAPASPSAPVVSVLVPRAPLSGCPPLSIDLSASSGSGGRPWRSCSFAVNGEQGYEAEVTAFLNGNCTFNGAFYVPSHLFSFDGRFYITVTLENFLGASATGIVEVNIFKNGPISPTVLIPGLQTRTVLSNETLSLAANAYTSDCNGVQSTANLTYHWRVACYGVLPIDLFDTHIHDSKLFLPAHRLEAGRWYTIEVKVQSTLTLRAVTYDIEVIVQEGALVETSGAVLQNDGVGTFNSDHAHAVGYFDTPPTSLRSNKELVESVSVDIKPGNLHSTISVPMNFVLTFGLTLPSYVSGNSLNIWELRDANTGATLLSHSRLDALNTVLTYNGSVIMGGTLLSRRGDTSFTVELREAYISVSSSASGGALDAVYIKKVNTVGVQYHLYASNPSVYSSGGSLIDFTITAVTSTPSCVPTATPTEFYSLLPTMDPSRAPSSLSSLAPSMEPSVAPVPEPSVSPTEAPGQDPTVGPSNVPTLAPVTEVTEHPSVNPSTNPSVDPSVDPSTVPSAAPSFIPSAVPSVDPSVDPSTAPSAAPSFIPSADPTANPSAAPSFAFTADPSVDPSTVPSAAPSLAPSTDPSADPSVDPSAGPSVDPSAGPSVDPTADPSAAPSFALTADPSVDPSTAPTVDPSVDPTADPSAAPSFALSADSTVDPSTAPSATLIIEPSAAPSEMPSTAVPTVAPSAKPTATPTVQATDASGIAIPAVPQLVSATFSNDGSYIIVAFSAATNQAGYSSSFVCSKVLNFTDASSASCMWTNSATLRANPSTSSLSLSSPLALVSGSGVRAVCSSGVSSTVCASWAEAKVSSTYVQSPSSPTAPVVVISMPSKVNGCSPVPVDLSSSSGSGGRAWAAPVFTVTSTQGDGSAVAAYLNKNYSFGGVVSVPISLFSGNGTYTIFATLRNFLGATNTAARSVIITQTSSVRPTVFIPGPAARTVSVDAALLLIPTAYTVDCSGVKSTANLVYTWTVHRRGEPEESLISESLDPSKFRLSAYRLIPRITYVITVQVKNTISKMISFDSISLIVQQGALVAQINAGSMLSLPIGVALTLDASSSRDEDVAMLTGTDAGLLYAWSCEMIFPSQEVCPLSTSAANVPKRMVKAETAETVAAGTIIKLAVNVTDSTTARLSSSSVLLTVQDPSAPLVTITSTVSSVTSINVDNRLTLAASITSQGTCTAQWSVDASTVNLATSALTPVSTVIPAASTRALNLVIAASALPQRSSLVFTLACGVSKAAITVTTNGPPLPGVFTVTPATGGIEMETLFAFSASFWSDTDLPITYQFGFVSPSSGSMLTVRTRSESSASTSTLPAGSSTAQYAFNCSALVYDVLNAVTTATFAVRVAALPSGAAALQESTAAQLNDANAESIDSIKTAISVGSAAMNNVNCSNAPACSSLNRAGCAKVQNTCGACLSGYIGDAGDKNSQCVSATAGSTGKVVGSSCATDAECGGWLACDTSLSAPVCYLPAKKCSNDCSGHGTCIAQNANSMKQISFCYAGDATCVVSCVCTDGYSGANCGTSVSDIETRQDLRSMMMRNLSYVCTSDDSDFASISWCSSSLASVTQNSYELSGASVDLINQVATSVLTNAASLEDFTFDQAEGVLSAIDAAAAATVRLNSTNTVAFAGQMMETIALFNSLVSSQLVAGQDAVDYIQDSFRTSSIRQLRGFNTSLKISSPLTALEQSNPANMSTIFVDVDEVEGEEEEFTVNIVATSASLYGELGSSFNSNPVQVTVSRTASTPTRLTLVLAHNEAGDFTSREEAATMLFNTTCTGLDADESMYNYTCPLSGEVLTHNCEGLVGVLTSYCPIRVPFCALVNITAGVVNTNSSDCKVLRYDSLSTTCSCQIQLSAEDTSRPRRLANNSVEQNSFYVSVVSVGLYTKSEFETTFAAAKNFNFTSDVAGSLIVILTIVGLTMFFVFGYWAAPLYRTCVKIWKNYRGRVDVEDPLPAAATLPTPMVHLVSEIFSSAFSDSPTHTRVWAELKRYHPYLSLFLGENGRKQQLQTAVQLFTEQHANLAVLAFFYGLQNPTNDRTCNKYLTERDCHARKGALDYTVPYCMWEAIDEQIFVCKFRDPPFSLTTVVTVSIVVAVVAAILSILSDVFFDWWTAPVEGKSLEFVLSNCFCFWRRRYASVAPDSTTQGVSRVHVNLPDTTQAALRRVAAHYSPTVLGNLLTRIAHRDTTRMTLYRNADGLPDADEPHTTPEVVMLHMVPRQRQHLPANFDRDDFDLKWGLDSTGQFAAGLPGYQDATSKLRDELTSVHKKVEKTAEWLSNSDNDVKRLTLLILMGVDMLGRCTPAAITFRDKCKENFQVVEKVSWWWKLAGGVGLFGFNGFVFSGAILVVSTHTIRWQKIFVGTYAVQLCVDIILLKTLETWWIHWVLPWLVRNEVLRVRLAMTELAQVLDQTLVETPAVDSPANEPTVFLNWARFFSVSSITAKRNRDLPESALVLSYESHLPCAPWRIWQVGYVKRWFRWRSKVFLGRCLIGAIRHFIISQFLVHKIILRFVPPLIFDGVLLLGDFIKSHTNYIPLMLILPMFMVIFGAVLSCVSLHPETTSVDEARASSTLAMDVSPAPVTTDPDGVNQLPVRGVLGVGDILASPAPANPGAVTVNAPPAPTFTNPGAVDVRRVEEIIGAGGVEIPPEHAGREFKTGEEAHEYYLSILR